MTIHRLPPAQRLLTYANMLTLTSLGASLLLMMQVSQHRFDMVGPLFLLAALCDGLDGYVARKRHTSGPLGMQLDSLVDMVSFGIAPALASYAYLAALGHPMPMWIIGGYAACTAIRLVHFNLQADKSVFFGLNSPSAASLLIFLIWSLNTAVSLHAPACTALVVNATLLFAAVMMVSPFRYISSKKLTLPRTTSGRLLLILVATSLVLLSPYALLACSALYALSGPICGLASWKASSGSSKVTS
jgi:CDP-diacylglycerol--serine O-phosphatidyltransferase